LQHETKLKLTTMMEKTGHRLRLDDLDDIIELDRLAERVADPQHGVDSPLKSHAVFVRGVPVHPLTLAHLTFIDEMAGQLARNDDERALFLLWVVTLPQIEDAHYDADETSKRFRAWARRCRWTENDIASVMELRYARLVKDAADQGDSENQDGALVSLLSREYGESPAYWMYEAPLGIIEACVADWNMRQEAQAAAYRRAAGGKGAAVAPAPSPKFVAVRKFRECAKRIEAKWLASDHS